MKDGKFSVGVLCSGRGSNLGAMIEASQSGKLGKAEIRLVLADSLEAGALTVARTNGIEASYLPRSAFHANKAGFERRLAELLAPIEPDLVVLAGFQRILGEVFLSKFPDRIINVHPALLPAFPGHGVWATEVDYGVRLAGATVHFVDGGVDSGPIIIQGAVPVLESDGSDELANRILAIEHRILPQAVAWLSQGRVRLDGRKVFIDGINCEVANGLNLVWPPLEV